MRPNLLLSRRPPFEKPDDEIPRIADDGGDPRHQGELDEVAAVATVRTNLLPEPLKNGPAVVINEDVGVVEDAPFDLPAEKAVFPGQVVLEVGCDLSLH